jgi:uncharacterized membrane protein YedE/YeeE
MKRVSGWLLLVQLLFAGAVHAAAPWQQAADAGDTQAQLQMGNAYAAGMPEYGIEQNANRAYAWYLKAARQNNADAQYQVAVSLILGEGTARNVREARVWLQRAAKQGHADAREVLAGFPAEQRRAAPAPVPRPQTGNRRPPQTVDRKPADEGLVIGNVRLDPEGLIDEAVNLDPWSGYWPWWLGGAALGFITVGFWLAIRATLGVSSSWDRIVGWREDRELAKAAAVLQETPTDVLESAMLAATMEQFGDDLPDEFLAQMESNAADGHGGAKSAAPLAHGPARTPLSAHFTFLISMMTGGFLANYLVNNGVDVSFDMGSEFARLFGSGPEALAILLVGGFMIGFGTRMGGGCSSGHGLSGCSRLQPGSLVGTLSFFGTAVAVSLALEMFL